MKNIICFFMLFHIMLALSLIQGCGKGGEDEIQKAAPETAAVSRVVEQSKEEAAVADEAPTKMTVPSKEAEEGPAGQAVSKVLSEEDDIGLSQTDQSDAVEEEGTPIAQEIIDVIVIENKGYASDKKGPVKFNHLKHSKEYEVSCIQCHHVYKDGENIWKEGDKTEKCITCHDPLEEKDNVLKLQNAFHKNCKDCHTEENKEGKEAPSTKCNGCHSQSASS